MSYLIGAQANNFCFMQESLYEPYNWVNQEAPWTDGALWSTAGTLGGGFSLINQDWSAYNTWSSQGDEWSFWNMWGNAASQYMGSVKEDMGGQQMKYLVGTTQDSNSNPLGSCTVRVYLTSSNLFVASTVSDTGGWFRAPSWYSGVNHYMVAYKGGSPDVTGASLNTLQPA